VVKFVYRLNGFDDIIRIGNGARILTVIIAFSFSALISEIDNLKCNLGVLLIK